MFPELANLCRIVNQKINAYYKSIGKPEMQCEFNHVSVKLYFRKKYTGDHTDIEFDKKHINPKPSNSQVPGTPVAIAMMGDKKFLQFTKYEWREDGGPKGNGAFVKTNKKFNIIQETNSLVAMDPRDEFLGIDRKSFYKHGSHLEDPKEGVAMSLMFRRVRTVKLVTAQGEYADKTVPGNGRRLKMLNKAWQEKENDIENYERKKVDCLQMIRKLLKY